MKVYQMKLILGKETQYTQDGKLKNQVIQPKYDEFELTNLLEESNWKKLGVCDIECISCIDYTPPTKTNKEVIVKNEARLKEINEQIKSAKESSKKPKTAQQMIAEQSEMMVKMAKKIEELEKCNNQNVDKTNERINLEDKAKELKIKFDKRLGDVKLLALINKIDSEYKL